MQVMLFRRSETLFMYLTIASNINLSTYSEMINVSLFDYIQYSENDT